MGKRQPATHPTQAQAQPRKHVANPEHPRHVLESKQRLVALCALIIGAYELWRSGSGAGSAPNQADVLTTPFQVPLSMDITQPMPNGLMKLVARALGCMTLVDGPVLGFAPGSGAEHHATEAANDAASGSTEWDGFRPC